MLALALAPVGAVAQQLVSLDDIVRVTLLPGWRLDNGNRMAAVRIDLAPGWKTYWRSPGDAGIPPTFDWSRSRNLSAATVHWPTPKVFELNGLRSVGYEGVVVLPLEVTPRDRAAGVDVNLRGTLEIGVCSDVCIPYSKRVSVDLSGAGATDDLIRKSLDSRPVAAADAGVGAVTCKVSPIDDGLRLEVGVVVPRLGSEEFAIVELPDPRIWISSPTVTRRGNQLRAVTELVSPNGRPFALDRSNVRTTLLAANSPGIEINGCSAG